MVDRNEVKRQLQRIGADFKFWGRAELRELPHILFDNELVEHVINGRYVGGFAQLVATNYRVLLIDKKPLYLTLEDIRYDMISDVMFNHRLLDASVNLGTMHKDITFLGYNPAKLRAMVVYIQQKVMEFRRMQDMQQHPLAHAPMPGPQLAEPATTNPLEPVIQNMVVPPQRTPINPYKSPVIIRRKVSRFY